ncbi:MAG: enoyl-CoA hydratase/isomerase family protein [Planctomycetota bacterium]
MTSERTFGGCVRWSTDGFRGTLTMARGKGNALSPELISGLSEALAAIASEPPDLVVLTGEDRFFSAGLDLVTLDGLSRPGLESFCIELDRLFTRLYELPAVTVAAVNGHAVAGGCVLMLCCDHRIAAEGPSVIGMNETQLGLPFPGACLDVFREVLMPSAFSTVVLAGRLMSVGEAKDLGLVDRVVAADDVEAAIQEWAEPLRVGGSEGRRTIKHQMRKAWRERYASGWPERTRRFVHLWFSEEARAERSRAIAKLKR